MEELKREISDFSKSLLEKRKRNRLWEKLLIVAAIILSSGVTLVGIFGWSSKVAGVLGVLLSVVLTVDRSFSFGEKAANLRLMETEAMNLAEDPKLTEEERWKKFSELRTKVAQTRSGEGIQAVVSRPPLGDPKA